jgi:hypothetical protein
MNLKFSIPSESVRKQKRVGVDPFLLPGKPKVPTAEKEGIQNVKDKSS